jgi:hypothetical protein
MKKEVLTIIISFFFIVIAFAPCINANNIKFSGKNEFVKLDIVISGIDGVNNYSVNLTKKQIDYVEKLFISLRNQLNESETYAESAFFINESISKLDNYGILGDFKVEQIQKLITKNCKNPRLSTIFQNINKRYKGNMVEDQNKNCLIVGRTTMTRIHSETSFFKILFEIIEESGLIDFFLLFEDFISWLDSNHQILSILFHIVTLPLWIVFIPFWILFALALSIDVTSPFSLFDSRTHGDMQFGYCHSRWHPVADSPLYKSSEGWVSTIGSNEIINWNDEFYGQLYTIIEPSPIGNYKYYIGASNFTGIKIKGLFGGYSYYIGKAEHVSLGSDIP